MCKITPRVQELMDKIIKEHGSLEAYAEKQKRREEREELDYWQGLNPEDLKKRYVGADEAIFRKLVPTWDLRRLALSIGDMANQINPASIPLYLATREGFMGASLYGDAEIGMVRGAEAKYLRVIGNWERGHALTPPLLFMHGDKLWKWDGHHRIMIALMSGAALIPFYCEDAFSFPGIILAPEWMQSEVSQGDLLNSRRARWRAPVRSSFSSGE